MPRLYAVTGAPGAGTPPSCHTLRAYPFGTVDFDELPEPDGSLLGIGIDITSPTEGPLWNGQEEFQCHTPSNSLPRRNSPTRRSC